MSFDVTPRAAAWTITALFACGVSASVFRSTDLSDSEPARIPLRLHEPATLTPLEAAVISERAYMIRPLRDRGARLDANELRTLRCIAQARKDRGTIAYPAELDASPLNCEGVKVPF